jgi:alkyldihydroxyacetonephosphate synthase
MPENNFIPDWYEQEAPGTSYRSLFKYGDPKGFKHPNRGLFRLIKESLNMTMLISSILL